TGSTPFMRAAYSLDVPAMKLLVRRGANYNEGIVIAAGRGFQFPAAAAAAGAGGAAAAGANGGLDPNVPRGTDGLPLAPTLAKIPTGPVLAIHYVAGEGYGEGFAGN